VTPSKHRAKKLRAGVDVVLACTWRWQSEILGNTEAGTTALKAMSQASRIAAF